MPELPEVETTRRGIEPHIAGRRIQQLLVHEPRLRWTVDADLPAAVAGQRTGSMMIAASPCSHFMLSRTLPGPFWAARQGSPAAR